MVERNKKLTWFDWLILIGGILILIINIPTALLNLLSGSFYVEGQPDKSFIIGAIWISIGLLAVVAKARKLKELKQVDIK